MYVFVSRKARSWKVTTIFFFLFFPLIHDMKTLRKRRTPKVSHFLEEAKPSHSFENNEQTCN